MASIQSIKIIVYDGGQIDSGLNGVGGKSKKDKEDKTTTFQKIANLNSTVKDSIKSKMSPNTYYAISSAVGLAKQTGRAMFNYYISDLGRANGDSNYQAQVGRRIEQVTDVTSIVGAGLSGLGAGAMGGGPIGAVVGGVVGVTSGAISNAFKYAERERTFAHEMFKQNNSQSYNLTRANYSATNGRQR